MKQVASETDMGTNSKIEWTDHTFNPWLGCTKVSPGCDHCYAEGWSKRSGLVKWGNHARRRTSDNYWKGPVVWNAAANEFERRHERRQRVFCASLADVFDNQVPLAWRAELRIDPGLSKARLAVAATDIPARRGCSRSPNGHRAAALSHPQTFGA
jgi:hypothetical protein